MIDHPSPRLRVINHPGTSCHPSAEGNLLRSRRGTKFPSMEGRARRAGWLESAGLAAYFLVIPGLDPGIQENKLVAQATHIFYSIRYLLTQISLMTWIPWSSHGMTLDTGVVTGYSCFHPSPRVWVISPHPPSSHAMTPPAKGGGH